MGFNFGNFLSDYQVNKKKEAVYDNDEVEPTMLSNLTKALIRITAVTEVISASWKQEIFKL